MCKDKEVIKEAGYNKGLKIKCDKCGEYLTKQGALLFYPPIDGKCKKEHICVNCFEAKGVRYMKKIKVPAYSYIRILPYKKARKIETIILGNKKINGKELFAMDVEKKTKKVIGFENLCPITLEIEDYE